MNKKTQKMTLLMTTMLLLTSICFIQNTIADATPGPHAVKGMLYINDEIAEAGIEIKINFTSGEESNFTFEACGGFNFNIGFYGYEDETGNITVLYEGQELVPVDNDTVYIPDEQAFIYVNLSVVYEEPVNHPPAKPMDPSPANNSINVSTSPELSVNVSDPDDDAMSVSFFDASDDSLIGTVEDVANGSTASIMWLDLEYNTTYSWYAVANDSEFENKSETWSFTTEKEDETEISFNIRVKMFGIGRICAKITNNGDTNLTDVDYKISMTGGLLGRVNVSSNCTFKNFSAGAKKQICTGRMFGKTSVRPLRFGRVSGIVEIKVDGETFTKEFSGRVISKLVIITKQKMVEE